MAHVYQVYRVLDGVLESRHSPTWGPPYWHPTPLEAWVAFEAQCLKDIELAKETIANLEEYIRLTRKELCK